MSQENGGSEMLILSTRAHESVVIGGHNPTERLLKMNVLEVQGGNVQLGLEVDDGVPVHRLWSCASDFTPVIRAACAKVRRTVRRCVIKKLDKVVFKEKQHA